MKMQVYLKDIDPSTSVFIQPASAQATCPEQEGREGGERRGAFSSPSSLAYPLASLLLFSKVQAGLQNLFYLLRNINS